MEILWGRVDFRKCFLPSIPMGRRTPQSRGDRCLHSGRGTSPHTAAHASQGDRDPRSWGVGAQQTTVTSARAPVPSHRFIFNAIVKFSGQKYATESSPK